MSTQKKLIKEEPLRYPSVQKDLKNETVRDFAISDASTVNEYKDYLEQFAIAEDRGEQPPMKEFLVFLNTNHPKITVLLPHESIVTDSCYMTHDAKVVISDYLVQRTESFLNFRSIVNEALDYKPTKDDVMLLINLFKLSLHGVTTTSWADVQPAFESIMNDPLNLEHLDMFMRHCCVNSNLKNMMINDGCKFLCFNMIQWCFIAKQRNEKDELVVEDHKKEWQVYLKTFTA